MSLELSDQVKVLLSEQTCFKALWVRKEEGEGDGLSQKMILESGKVVKELYK